MLVGRHAAGRPTKPAAGLGGWPVPSLTAIGKAVQSPRPATRYAVGGGALHTVHPSGR